MLNLSDADLAKLRLECLLWAEKLVHIHAKEQCPAGIPPHTLAEACADDMVAWCLRDREPVE